MSVSAGDSVTIDWEVQNPDGLLGAYVNVFPVGTNDYNFHQMNTTASNEIEAGDARGEIKFEAGQTGVMPLEFFENIETSSDSPGPYNFTAYETHGMIVSLAPLPRASTGAARISAHDPSGNPLAGPAFALTLQMSIASSPWQPIGTAAPDKAGNVVIPYRFPTALAGKKIRLRAVGQAASYATAFSTIQTITLPPCVVPELLGLRLKAAKAALLRADCTLGRIHHRKTRRRLRGRVIFQAPDAGQKRSGRVGITIGR